MPVIENMVARDGVEPPTPAFSASLSPAIFQQLNFAEWPLFCDHSVTSADVRLSVGANPSHAACQRPVDLRQFQAWIPSNGEIRELAPQSGAPRHGWKVLEFGSSCCLLL